MSLYTIQGAFDLGCIFAILALGLYISFKILNIPDLTVDGSFTLGAACSGVLCVAGYPIIGILVALIAGGLAGGVSGFLQTKLKIQMILAGILTMTALYSINLRILGNSPSLSLFGSKTIFTYIEEFGSLGKTGLIVLIAIIVAILLYFFLRTNLGLALRAVGDNEVMVRASSINTDTMKIIGLALANALVALAGAISVQYQVFADSTSGTGTLVIALASIIIGETLFSSHRLSIKLFSVIIGAILYRFILAIALQIGINSTDLKLLSALLVAIAITLPTLKHMFNQHQKRRQL